MELVSIQDFIPPKEKLQKVSEDNLNSLDRKFLYILLLLVSSGIFFSFQNDTWLEAISIGVFSMTIYIVGFRYLANRHQLRLLLIFSLLLLELQLIIQFKSSDFSSIYYYIILTSLILYKDWRYLMVFFFISQILITLTPLFLSWEVLTAGSSEFFFGTLEEFFNREYWNNLARSILHLAVCLITARYLYQQSTENAKQKVYLQEQLHIEANLELVDQIAKGQLEEYYPFRNNDIMGQKLLEMRDNLREIQEKEEAHKWVSTGLTSISDLLLTTDNLKRLSNKVLKELVTYLSCYQGGLFLLNDEDDKNVFLELTSAYAYGKRQKDEARIEIGEGLVGEVAVNKKTMFLDEIPVTFEPISSGMGEAAPKSILIIPLKVKDTLIGVLEVSAFHTFNKREREFLDQVAENIAITILSLKSKLKTNKLLESAQKYNEQLKEQEEKMRQNVEVLNTTQEEMAEKQRLLEENETKMKHLLSEAHENNKQMQEQEEQLIAQMRELNEIQKQREKNQKALEVNNLQMSAILNASRAAIISFSPINEKLIACNPAAIKMFKIDDKNLDGYKISELIGKDFKKSLQEEQHIMASRCDKVQFDAELFTNQYLNEQGETTYIAYVQDITEDVRKEKEIKQLLKDAQSNNKKLKEHEETIKQNMHMMGDLYDELSEQFEDASEKLKTLNSWISSIEGCIYRYDFTDKGKKLKFLSDEVKIVTGYSKKELKAAVNSDWNHRSLITEQDRNSYIGRIEEVEKEIEHTGTYEMMYRIETKEGNIIWVEEIFKINTDKNGQKLQVGVIYKVNAPN